MQKPRLWGLVLDFSSHIRWRVCIYTDHREGFAQLEAAFFRGRYISDTLVQNIPCDYFRMTWVRQLMGVVLSALLAVSCLAQTFQYSRGWTNGKRSGGYPLSQAGCQLQRLRAILEEKVSAANSGYLLCELYRVPEEDPRLEHLSKMQPNNPLQEEIVE